MQRLILWTCTCRRRTLEALLNQVLPVFLEADDDSVVRSQRDIAHVAYAQRHLEHIRSRALGRFSDWCIASAHRHLGQYLQLAVVQAALHVPRGVQRGRLSGMGQGRGVFEVLRHLTTAVFSDMPSQRPRR